MLCDIFSPHFPVTEALNGHIRASFKNILLHYEDRIRIMKVRLTDVNGPKGGEDKVCRLQVQVDHHPSVNTEGRHTDLYSAITLAVHRMERSLAPMLDETRTRNPNSRNVIGAVGSAIHFEKPFPKQELEDSLLSRS